MVGFPTNATSKTAIPGATFVNATSLTKLFRVYSVAVHTPVVTVWEAENLQWYDKLLTVLLCCRYQKKRTLVIGSYASPASVATLSLDPLGVINSAVYNVRRHNG
jgi:hypothetical protein